MCVGHKQILYHFVYLPSVDLEVFRDPETISKYPRLNVFSIDTVYPKHPTMSFYFLNI